MDRRLPLFLSLSLITGIICSEGNVNVELLIIPSPISKGLSTYLKRVEDTLNLTCAVISQDSGDLPKFDLMWNLPFTPQNSQNRVTYGVGNNMINLIVENLKESDSGDYNCEARLGDVFMRETVKINVKNKKICNDQMFPCPSGPCISRRFMCDGLQDCKTGADEAEKYCGIDACATKLYCENGRCIPTEWCCDQYTNPNCTVKFKLQCCVKRNEMPIKHDDRYSSTSQQRHSDMGFLQTTIYTVIGCAMAFMFIVTILVVAICRVHMKRASTLGRIASVSTAHGIRCTRIANNGSRFPVVGRGSTVHSLLSHHPPHAALSGDPSASPLHSLQLYDLDVYLNAASIPSGRESLQNSQASSQNPHSLLVTYNINNGVQFVARPVDPPPYCEVMCAPPREGPPPPYVSHEDITSAELTSQVVNMPSMSNCDSNSNPAASQNSSTASSTLLPQRTVEEAQQTDEDALSPNREPQVTDSLLGSTSGETSGGQECNV